ncbi:MAG TPA: aminotransferase class I/II-fold pyridoxal phosphate-dependent enzyme [Stellaceae bacterium]|jgi:cystathionine gamma-synthase|nr:aminotransferase class I/II-fold pyridoxal phosphate-dependent enzyme [Stellaceae bacterium]
MKTNRQPPNPATLAAQGLGWTDAQTGAVVMPIQPATTYIRDPDNQYRRGRNYARADNPGYDQPEALLTALEGGAASLVLSSGMAAAANVFRALPVGAHVVGPKVMYHSLRRWIAAYAADGHIAADFVDMTSLDALRDAVQPGRTKLVWAETPANPLWSITDIAGAAEIAHKAGALLAVDSTTASPVLTRPVEHGADIVMHSATKYLNGHSDVIAGTLTGARDDEFWQKLVAGRSSGGAILGSLEAYLLLRGMRTLFLRVERACASAQRVAAAMAGHPLIEEVLYPGLPGHSGHAVAARQMTGGFGGMLSIRVKGGEDAAIATAARVEIWKRATSLGGVESLMEHRASIEGAGTAVPSDLLRLSVGIEDPQDLIDDLDQALTG